MEGYDVISGDDEKAGTIVGSAGEYVIVERGMIFKSRHALPRAFTHVDDAERRVRISVSKEILEDAPTVDRDGQFDEQDVARHYGLAGGDPAPLTQGYGELTADDPARGAETQGARAGTTPAPQERAAIRESMRPEGQDESGPGRPIIPPDPHR